MAVKPNVKLCHTYLDQNALIELGKRSRQDVFRKRLDAVVESRSLVIVVSAWHLIETANTKNLTNAIALAQFTDSLGPAWLLERRDIQRIEVAEDFFRFAKMPYHGAARVTTRSAAFAMLNGEPEVPKFDIPSARFVKQWIEHPEQLEALEQSCKAGIDALVGMRGATKAGKITDDIRRRADEALLRSCMPTSTPAGLQFGRELAEEYIRQAKIDSIPTLAIETAISEQEWAARDGSGADRNTFIDKFHVISALPYVDEIVSDDGFFYKAYPLAQKTGHARARLLHNNEFLERFRKFSLG